MDVLWKLKPKDSKKNVRFPKYVKGKNSCLKSKSVALKRRRGRLNSRGSSLN